MFEREPIIDLFDQLIHDAQGEMWQHLNFNPKDLRISAPEFIIDAFRDALGRHYAIGDQASAGKDFIYRGLQFIPCHALEIAVWHRDYPLYRHEWMLRKIPLDAPQTIDHGAYKEHMIKMLPLFRYYSLNTNTEKLN